MRRGSIIPILLLGALPAGCGSGAKKPVAPPAAPTATRQDPRLVAPGTPGATVVRLWGAAKVGAVPSAALEYTDAAQGAIGADALAAALAAEQDFIGSLDVVVAGAERTPAGMALTVLGTQGDATKVTYHYLLRHEGGRWLVSYDDLLSSAVSAYVSRRAQVSIDPGATQIGAEANAAGARAAQRLRVSSQAPATG